MKRKKEIGFTLIELLIVVAIIAILALIAVPNFLEAQIRSKVSKVHAELRNLAPPIEAYCIDYNKYPLDYSDLRRALGHLVEHQYELLVLTTPVAYITSLPFDQFYDVEYSPNEPPRYWYFENGWRTDASFWAVNGYLTSWILVSHGPNKQNDWGEWALAITPHNALPEQQAPNMIYDPTNGTVSYGDIIRMGP